MRSGVESSRSAEISRARSTCSSRRSARVRGSARSCGNCASSGARVRCVCAIWEAPAPSRSSDQATSGGTTAGISAASSSARTGLTGSTSVSSHAVVSTSQASGSPSVASRITIRAQTRSCALSRWGSAAACSEAVNSSTRSVPSSRIHGGRSGAAAASACAGRPASSYPMPPSGMRLTTNSTKGRSIGHCSKSPDCATSAGVAARASVKRARASAGATVSSTSSSTMPSRAMSSRYFSRICSNGSGTTNASLT